MAINYERVNWDTTMYVNPTNMNKMDKGIKDACDQVDINTGELTEIADEISAINTNLVHEVYTQQTDLGMGARFATITLPNKEGYKCIGASIIEGNWNYAQSVSAPQTNINNVCVLRISIIDGTEISEYPIVHEGTKFMLTYKKIS